MILESIPLMRNPPGTQIVTHTQIVTVCDCHTYPNSHQFLVSRKCDHLETLQYLKVRLKPEIDEIKVFSLRIKVIAKTSMQFLDLKLGTSIIIEEFHLKKISFLKFLLCRFIFITSMSFRKV